MNSPVVAIESCESYDAAPLDAALARIAGASDFPEVRGKTVLLKPNILSGSPPEKAVTTHPEIVSAVIRLLKKKGAAEILVGDSPGVGSAEAAGRKCGIREAADREGARWVTFRETCRIPLPEGKAQKQFYPTACLEEADVLISLPKMKTHEMMYYTGAIKNLFGLIPGLNKSRFHMNFPEKEDFASLIVDLYQAVRPSYAIMDGITAMEGPGPGSGYPRQVGLLFGSAALTALDWAAASVMGYSPEQIPILRESVSRGIDLSAPDEIRYPLLDPSDLVIGDFKRVKILKDTGFFRKAVPPGIFKIVRNLYVPRPFFSHKKCIRCGECISICPADALSFEGKGKERKVRIRYNRCIRCYCCHEICPVDAIRVGRI